MADYSVVFARSTSKELRSLDAPIALRILKRIEALSRNPRPAGVVKLEGATDLQRARVGEWRVIYRIADSKRLVDVISVRHRREAYRQALFIHHHAIAALETMIEQDVQVAVREFFEDFNAVFATFSGHRIAERYVAPYLAIRSNGSSEAFNSVESIAAYFQRIVDGYHARGCRVCKYRDLAIVPLGSAAALGTVTWELCRADGTLVTTWRESYNLVLVDGRMKAAASVNHASNRQETTR